MDHEAACGGGGGEGSDARPKKRRRRRRQGRASASCRPPRAWSQPAAASLALLLQLLLALVAHGFRLSALPRSRLGNPRTPVLTTRRTTSPPILAAAAGDFGDPFWFEDDEEESGHGGSAAKEGPEATARRRQQRRQRRPEQQQSPHPEKEEADEFWRRKDRERLKSMNRQQFELARQPLSPALRKICHAEIALLRATFNGPAAAAGVGPAAVAVAAAAEPAPPAEEGEDKEAVAEASSSTAAIKLTGCAIMLHGGASVAWEQRSYQAPAAPSLPASSSAATDVAPLSPATQTRPTEMEEEGDTGAETTTFEVTTEAGGGGGYEWLAPAEASDATKEGSWLALPMRWQHEGFPIGVLFVRLSGAKGEEGSGLRRQLRHASRNLARRLMETSEMRQKFHEWRAAAASSSSVSDGDQGLQALDGQHGEPPSSLRSAGHEAGGQSTSSSSSSSSSSSAAALVLAEAEVVVDDGVKVSAADQSRRLDAVIWRLALPLALSLGLEPLCSLIDTYFVGKKMGPRSLSAFGLADRVFVIGFFVINFSLATPTTPLVARLRAMGQEDVAFSLVFRLGIGTLLFGVCFVPVLLRMAAPLLSLLSGGGAVDKGVFAAAIEYFSVRVLSAPAVLLNALMVGALRGFLDTTTPLLVVLAAFLLDYSLQPQWFSWLLPGKALSPTTLPGFGITTVIADYSQTAAYVLKLASMHPALALAASTTTGRRASLQAAVAGWVRRARRRLARRKRGRTHRWFWAGEEVGSTTVEVAEEEEEEEEQGMAAAAADAGGRRRRRWLRRLSALWRPRAEPLTPALLTIASQALSVFTRSLLYQLLLLAASSSLVARSGKPSELAAHQLAMQLWLLPSVILDSLAIVGQGLVADCIGRSRVARARKVARSLLQYGSLSGAVVGACYLLGARSIPGLLSPDVSVTRKVLPIMPVVAMLVPVTAVVQVGGGILQGAADFDYQAKLMGACVVVVGGLLHLLTRRQGSGGGLLAVWLALLLFQVLRMLGFANRFWRDTRCPLSVLPPHKDAGPAAPSFLERVKAWLQVDSFDDAYNYGMASPARLLLPKPKTPQIKPEDID